MERRTFLACGAAFVAAGVRPARAHPGDSVKMPLLLENNRIYANFGYAGADGKIQQVLTNIDTGGGAVILARHVVDRLHLATHADKDGPPGMLRADLPAVYADTLRLPVSVAATSGAETSVFHQGASSPAFLPGRVLSDHIITFDYANKALWLDGPPLLEGVPLVVRVARRTAFPRVELEIDGERMGFLFDTGASFTTLSQRVIDRLRAKHAEWTYVAGAYGPANMIGKGDLASHMLRIPTAQWGSLELTPLNVVSRAEGVFENYMAPLMSAPIVGALAGNVLRNFAFRLNYPGNMLDALFTPQPWPQEFMMVPLIVHAEKDGSYTIAGGAASDGIAGAQIVAIDAYPVSGLSLFAVQDLLRGETGSTHLIRVRDARGERNVRLRVVNVF
jgi:hypothetical protein